ncbi:hypothetical protein [Salinibacillus xinjiangensis]|uniref:Uncharacterized protein n=1 Tax=Salinibacillus xinjiangensis TaxID=1229268 RepID=A0A6G1X836_9BACI|nr:hypothetical protein [Salinibacillus xinjiangensis]MRG87065.1 hypothetical protein [Salinibacillus xinjiangensis]
MKVMIMDCFHWMGFHLVEKYLSEGIEVIGLDQMDHPRKEFLYSMIGRNALFEWNEDISKVESDESKHSVIAFNQQPTKVKKLLKRYKIRGDFYFIMEEGNSSRNNSEELGLIQNEYMIYTPALMGKWMDDGRFHEVTELEEYIWMDDFVSWLFSFIEQSNKPNLVYLTNQYSRGELDFTSHVSKQDAIEQIQEHISNWKCEYYHLNS